MNAIGFVELNSIAKGIEVTDFALKASDIEIVSSFAGCPGKYYFMFCGNTSAVDAALKVCTERGSSSIVDSIIISNVHPDVISAISKTTSIRTKGSLGILEFFSVTAAIYAADAAVKAADVYLIEIRTGIGIGGKSFVILTGDVAAVESAVEVASQSEHVQGVIVDTAVIANPAPELFESIC